MAASSPQCVAEKGSVQKRRTPGCGNHSLATVLRGPSGSSETVCSVSLGIPQLRSTVYTWESVVETLRSAVVPSGASCALLQAARRENLLSWRRCGSSRPAPKKFEACLDLFCLTRLDVILTQELHVVNVFIGEAGPYEVEALLELERHHDRLTAFTA